MTTLQHELTVTGDHTALPQIADFVEAACEQCCVDPCARFDIQLAVEEACCNIIEHAYSSAGGRLHLRFEVKGPDVEVTLHDSGQPFDPAAIPTPDLERSLEERPIGGLGLHLMRQLMDEVSFDFAGDAGNTLAMVKRNAVRQPAPGRPPCPSRPAECADV